MIVGYSRTSTVEQKAGLEAQIAELTRAGCEKLFSEQVSSVDMDARSQFAAALDFVREGDVLIVTKIDRLARSMVHLLEIVAKLNAKKVSLRILGMGMDTSTPNGKLMLNVLGSVAEFERDIMLDRQRAGIAKAKGEGRYKGRAPTARAKSAEVLAMHKDGIATPEIAKRLEISRVSAWRIIKAAA